MLKLYFFLMMLLLLAPFESISQVDNHERLKLITPGIRQWFSGWYINLDGDTVKGYIYLSNEIDNQVNFQYSVHNPPDINTKTLDASMSTGFRVKDRVYELLIMESTKNASVSFVRRLEQGQLKLFAWYKLPTYGTIHDGNNDRPVTVNDEKFHERVFILKLGGGEQFFVPSSDKFAEVMSKVLAEDAELSNRIAQKIKGYRSTDILNIVQQYNQWFSSPH